MPNTPADTLRSQLLALRALSEAPGWTLLTGLLAGMKGKRLTQLRSNLGEWERGVVCGDLERIDYLLDWPEKHTKLIEAEIRRLEGADEETEET